MVGLYIGRAVTIVSQALLLSQLGVAQNVFPSNDTTALHPSSDLSLFVSPSLGGMEFKLEPLSADAGLGATVGVSFPYLTGIKG